MLTHPIERAVRKDFAKLGPVSRSEVCLLTEIARLALSEEVRLSVCDLAHFELFTQTSLSQPHRRGHVFHNVPIATLRSGMGISSTFASRELQLPEAKSESDQLKQLLASHPDLELQALVREFGKKNAVDIAQLLVASRHGIDCFLCDPSFKQPYAAFLQRGNAPLHALPLLPSELVALARARKVSDKTEAAQPTSPRIQ